jgi:hypothetical protein
MENVIRDEIIEELWQIKARFSFSCNRNIGELIKKMNAIAEELNFAEKKMTGQSDRVVVPDGVGCQQVNLPLG